MLDEMENVCQLCKEFNCTSSLCNEEKAMTNFLILNNLNKEFWHNIIIHIPLPGIAGAENEFYFRLENLGNKTFFDADKYDKVIQWMKITQELFGY